MNEFTLGWAHIIAGGAGTILSGLLLYLIKRLIDRKDAEEAERVAWQKLVDRRHHRYDRNFVRIQEHSDVKLETEEKE